MRLQFIALTIAVSITAAAQAGVVVQIAGKDSAGKQSDASAMYVQNGMLRDDRLDERGHVTHFSLFRDGVVWEVDVQKRTYSRLDKASMQARMDEAPQRMKEMAVPLPPERRALLEQRLQQMQQPQSNQHAYRWTDTGATERGGPYSCRVWELKRDDKVEQQDCFAPFSSLPGGDELAAAVRQALATSKEIASATPAAARAAEIFSGLAKANGWPVLTRQLSGGKTYREEFAKSVEHRSLPADKFEIPKGFTEQPSTKGGADEQPLRREQA